MKERVNISVVQLASEWLNREGNRAKLVAFAEKEAQGSANLIVFPELTVCGYIFPLAPGEEYEALGVESHSEFFAQNIQCSETIPGPTTDALSRVAQKYGTYIIFGLSQLHPTIPATLYNAAVLIGPQGVIGVHHKLHLATSEKHFFYPGRAIDVYPTELGNIGMMVCYDTYFPELARSQALKGAEIICGLFAGRRVPGLIFDEDLYRRLACVRAKENSIYFVSCMHGGNNGKFTYVGHSAIASPMGKSLAVANTGQETVIRAELTHEELVKARGLFTIFRDRRPELYGSICEPLGESSKVP